jgi:hypothetical protein
VTPTPKNKKEGDGVPQASIELRLRQAADLPDILAAGFDAFEALRITARTCQDRAPGLLAAFMTAADAAVDGRASCISTPVSEPTRACSQAERPPRGRARFSYNWT